MMFNRLTPPELERLAILAEELGEVSWMIGKILRFGYASTHPDGGPDNRTLLEQELGDVMCAVRLMTNAGDVRSPNIQAFSELKEVKLGRYLKHQGG